MKILSILSRKGGSGKTTLCVHLAVLAQSPRRRVLIVDCDPQKSATKWFEARMVETPELVSTSAAQLPAVLNAARADGVDLVVVDSRPSVERDTAQIAVQSDYVLIPSRPSILDLQAIKDTVEVVRHVGKPGAIVLNACPASRGLGESAITRESRIMLSDYHVGVCPYSIAARVAMSNALIDGRAVHELEPGGKAAAEVARLWKWIEGELS